MEGEPKHKPFDCDLNYRHYFKKPEEILNILIAEHRMMKETLETLRRIAECMPEENKTVNSSFLIREISETLKNITL